MQTTKNTDRLMDYDLRRFIKAQSLPYSGYSTALEEIKAGRKRSHWIWYIFPQLKGLGHSYNAEYYGIAEREEAEAYLADATLGLRLWEISLALLAVNGKSASEILGDIDAMKVKSSMTLFDAISPGDVFAAVIDKYFDGKRDGLTLKMLDRKQSDRP